MLARNPKTVKTEAWSNTQISFFSYLNPVMLKKSRDESCQRNSSDCFRSAMTKRQTDPSWQTICS